MKPFSRREMLMTLPLAAAGSRVLGQSVKGQLPVTALSHVTLSVSDPKRSIEFYQTLFGLPIQSYQGPTDAAPPALRIGAGPQFIFFSRIRGGGKPGIDHFCMTTPNFSVDRVTGILGEHGVTKVDGAGAGIAGGPMRYRIRIRDERTGGSKEGTPEMYIGDPDGLAVQLQDTTYCGGSGPMGEVCFDKPVPAPKKRLIELKDFSHFTLTVSDPQRSLAFYQNLFAMPKLGPVGGAERLGVGKNSQWLSIVTGATPRISHVCFTMENFDRRKVAKTLDGFGVKPTVTDELYFTDPDGTLLQIRAIGTHI